MKKLSLEENSLKIKANEVRIYKKYNRNFRKRIFKTTKKYEYI